MRSAWWLWLWLWLGLVRTQAADVYRLDTVNTRISFNIQHLGVLWVSARFPDFSGAFVFEHDGPASRVDVSVQMASAECSDSNWNGRLRSVDWLDVQRYPQMTFHSNQVQFSGDGRAIANGELTLHGVTRPVGLAISGLSCSGARTADDSCSFIARARIKRSDFGFAHGLLIGGDVVDIAISGVGLRETPARAHAAADAAGGAATAAHQ
jgi:polyisoprenoid-binding protein YceI